MRPSNQHWKALVELADSLGLGHLFTESEEARLYGSLVIHENVLLFNMT